MAVTLEAIQSGSGSTAIHAQSGDTLTLQLNETVESDELDQAVADANDALLSITGVTFAFSNAGGASQVLAIAQSGSGSTTINALKGDTVTFELAETVQSGLLDQATQAMNDALYPITGVTIAFNNAGGAS